MESTAGGMESAEGGMESFQRNVWNQERRETEKCSLSADAMPDEVGIPYTLKRDAIPSPSVLDKNNGFLKSRYFLVDHQGLEPWTDRL